MSNDINQMDFRQLRNEVQLLRDELAIMQRKYEDILCNLDTDNFSSRFVKEQGDMRTAIEVAAEGVKSKVSREDLEAYSTKTQTAEQIQNIVSKNAKLDEAISISSIDKATDTSKIYVIRETDDDDNVLSETYYYFNDITKNWEVLSGDNIYTVFQQTANGFKLKGNVKVDGSLILTDTLTFNSTNRPLDVQYSTDGDDWHYEFDSSSDQFMRIKIGSQWSEAMKVVGDDGNTASVTFATVNKVLGYLYKTVDGEVPTKVTGAYIWSPKVLGGEFYGSVFYAGDGNGYSQMDADGFNVYDINEANKIALGYVTKDWTYPYLILGEGSGYSGSGAGVVYKMDNGLWIGDSCVVPYGGSYPGNTTHAEDISLSNATGIYIDFNNDKIYKYIKGKVSEL